MLVVFEPIFCITAYVKSRKTTSLRGFLRRPPPQLFGRFRISAENRAVTFGVYLWYIVRVANNGQQGRYIMKCRLLAAAVLLLACGGCVGYYYEDPYPYSPYPYNHYYYSPYYSPAYRSPAVYYDPGWTLFYPSFYWGSGYRGYRGHHHGWH
jgi:hypothetical protein